MEPDIFSPLYDVVEVESLIVVLCCNANISFLELLVDKPKMKCNARVGLEGAIAPIRR